MVEAAEYRFDAQASGAATLVPAICGVPGSSFRQRALCAIVAFSPRVSSIQILPGAPNFKAPTQPFGVALCLAAVDHPQSKEVTAMGDSAREMARAIVHFR
jgi:hypothetical protein